MYCILTNQTKGLVKAPRSLVHCVLWSALHDLDPVVLAGCHFRDSPCTTRWGGGSKAQHCCRIAKQDAMGDAKGSPLRGEIDATRGGCGVDKMAIGWSAILERRGGTT